MSIYISEEDLLLDRTYCDENSIDIAEDVEDALRGCGCEIDEHGFKHHTIRVYVEHYIEEEE